MIHAAVQKKNRGDKTPRSVKRKSRGKKIQPLKSVCED